MTAPGMGRTDECGTEWFGDDPHHPHHCAMPWVHVGNRHTCPCGATWLEHGRTPPGVPQSADLKEKP